MIAAMEVISCLLNNFWDESISWSLKMVQLPSGFSLHSHLSYYYYNHGGA